ncbi:MAG TPA: DNA-3-methyladenine glycosylase 2 family protein [Acholeplasmataceae bacterium]|jgi:3-methyladenine DNA glycosylase/8-oxoguanine DNA glycosylase|nr:DNA-3-methyladenine glycosylase 2 family protein [Acholeplasmataceae bacterium]
MEIFKYTTEELEILKGKDKKLKEYIEKVGMIERKINSNLFEELIGSIVSQQISTKAAETVSKRLIDLVGLVTPENILNTDKELLRKCGMSERKVSYIFDAANKFYTKELDVDSLKHLSDDEFIKKITIIKGVGIWTAEMLLIFSLNRKNILSFNDYGIKKGLKILYNLDEVTRDNFEYYKNLYSPFSSIASLYLWDIASKN